VLGNSLKIPPQVGEFPKLAKEVFRNFLILRHQKISHNFHHAPQMRKLPGVFPLKFPLIFPENFIILNPEKENLNAQ